MINENGPLHYNNAAVLTTNEVWQCVKCKRGWRVGCSDAEKTARECCAEIVPCVDCGVSTRRRGFRTRCHACEGTYDLKRWQALEKTDWDGETPLCVYRDDKYFYDEDDVAGYIDDVLLDGGTIDDVRLVVCKPLEPRHFEFCTFFADDAHESTRWPQDRCEAIEKAVNELAASVLSRLWYPTNIGVNVSSLPLPPEETANDQ